MSSYLSPQFKYMVFHIFTCRIVIIKIFSVFPADGNQITAGCFESPARCFEKNSSVITASYFLKMQELRIGYISVPF